MADAAKVNETMESAIIESTDKLAGAASLLELLEDKADNQQITPSELAAVRCAVEFGVERLNEALRACC